MKAVWIMHDIVCTDEIQAVLDDLGVVGFSRWQRMTGRGSRSGTRMDNHVWPGANAGTLVVLADDLAARLLARLQAMRDEAGGKTGVWAFATPVLETLQ